MDKLVRFAPIKRFTTTLPYKVHQRLIKISAIKIYLLKVFSKMFLTR